jgi:hypothetical protein
VGKTKKSGMIKGEGGFRCIKGTFVKGSSVSDLYSFDPDPAFEAEYRSGSSGALMTKNWKKIYS